MEEERAELPIEAIVRQQWQRVVERELAGARGVRSRGAVESRRRGGAGEEEQTRSRRGAADEEPRIILRPNRRRGDGTEPYNFDMLDLLLRLAFDSPSMGNLLPGQQGSRKRKRKEWTEQSAKRFRRKTRRARPSTLVQEGVIEKTDNCAVCLEPLCQEGGFLRSIPSCGHAFHERCLGRWVRGNEARNCPLCRHEFL